MSDDMTLTKQDKVYLNSVTRPTKQIIFAVLKIVILFVIASVIATFVQTGTVGFDFSKIGQYFRPGQPLFAVIVGAIPMLLISVMASYFGEGSKERLIVSFVKVGFTMLWLYFIAMSVKHLDLYQLSGMDNKYIDHFVVNAMPFVNVMVLVSAISAIVPVAEFIGARKKHIAAVEKKQRIKAAKKGVAAEPAAEEEPAVKEEPVAPKETVEAVVEEKWTGTPTLTPVQDAEPAAEKPKESVQATVEEEWTGTPTLTPIAHTEEEDKKE